MTRKPPADLDESAPKWLERVLAFSVMTDETNPHDAGPLDVVVDTHGISLCWSGENKTRWQATWQELRDTIETRQQAERWLAEAEKEHTAALEMFREAQDEFARAKGEAIILPLPPRGSR